MTARPARLAATLVALLLAAAVAAAWPHADTVALAQSPQALEIDAVDTGEHPEVTITVTAPSELVGQQLPDDAFTVTEAGVGRPATFEPLPSDDLEVVLLVDTSGSMGTDPMQAAREAATGFVEAMPPGVRMAVVEFNSEPAVLTEFSGDHDATADALAGLESGGFTALYDAVLVGLGLFDDAEDTRRAMVVLSDGGDTISDAGLEETRAALLEGDANLFVVELQTAESDPDALVTLARAADGRVVSTGDPAELAGLYEEVASKLVNQFAVTYDSAGTGRTIVRVDLRADDVSAFSSQHVRLPAGEPEDAGDEQDALPAIVGQVLSVGWVADSWVPYAGAGVMFTAMALLLLAALAPRPQRVVLDGPPVAGGARDGGLADGGPLTAATHRLVSIAQGRLERKGTSGQVAGKLERAGVNLRPGEYVVLSGGVAVIAASLGSLMFGLLGAIAGGVLAVVAARFALTHLAERRKAAFADQLPGTLQLLSGSLRTGYGVMQALDAVVREADEPTASEFRRLLMENRLGRDLSDSLAAMSERIGLDDFDWVVQAINIHRDVGGDLAEVLDRVADTIREREQIRRQIKSLSAEGRLSAIILVALPIFVAVAINLMQPGYLGELTSAPIGWVMIAMGTGLMVVGTIWVRRLVRLVF